MKSSPRFSSPAVLVEGSKQAFSSGKHAEAERLCQEAVRMDPRLVIGWVVLGMIGEAKGDFNLQNTSFERALAIDPECRETLYLRANLALRDKKMAEVEYCFKRLVEINPNDANAHDSLGICYLGRGEAVLAESEFGKAVALTPASSIYHHNRGNALQVLNRSAEAEVEFRRAVKLAPKSVDSLLNLAQTLLPKGDAGAQEFFKRAYEQEPKTPRGLFAYANVLYLAGLNHESGVEALETALTLDPTLGGAHALLGMLQHQLGRIDEGNLNLEKAIELRPELVGPYGALFHAKRISASDAKLVERLVTMTQDPNRTKRDLQIVEFSLGKANNDLGNYGDAMSHYHVANRLALENKWHSFDSTLLSDEIDGTINTFTPELFTRLQGIGSDTEAPIFIIGMYRSGSTLIEQTLSKHPEVGAGGELPFWPFRAVETTGFTVVGDSRATTIANEYLQLLAMNRVGKKKVTDKQLENYRFVGLLHLLFPKAKFLYSHRNPVDNALSIYMTNFLHPLSNVSDQDEIVFTFREHARLMAHWKRVLPPRTLLQVEYEEVAGNFETSARQIIDFCGLDWNDDCLQPESSEHAVRTASAWQVRQPVYQTSINRRVRYEPFLGAFAELADLKE